MFIILIILRLRTYNTNSANIEPCRFERHSHRHTDWNGKAKLKGGESMTDKEKAICKQYSKRDIYGKVHCVDCPLVIDKTACVCKKVLEDSRD